MREYKAGEIVEIAFPFEEGTGEKVRPALVLHDYGDELLLIKITSQLKGREYDIAISPDDFNGLIKRSAIQVDKCSKVHKAKLSAIIPRGTINPAQLGIVKDRLKESLKSK